MKFNSNTKSLTAQKTDCIILGVYEKGKFTDSAQVIDSSSGKYLSKLVKAGDIKTSFGASLLLHEVPGIKAERLLVMGLGPAKQFDSRRYHQTIKAATKLILSTPCKAVINSLPELSVEEHDEPWRIRQAVMATDDVMYQYDETKSKKAPKHRLQQMSFTLDSKKIKHAITTGQGIANGVSFCKELANLPGNICTPSYLAKQANQLAKTYKSISSKSLNEAEMKKLGMNSLLSVSAGSDQPAKLIIMEYKGSNKKTAKPIVLVGKGITFDSGGISLKPGANMDEMKYDMGGAASVFGTMRAVAELKLPVNVVGVVASAENMPSGKATKPGDIFTSMSGQTIEVLNTDAEGRLVLCDALTYIERFNPEVVIDIATLTGAMVVSLGDDVTGFFSNNDKLAAGLSRAATEAADHAWQMPLWRHYDAQLKSNFADLQNIGSRWGGAITAACFLAHFTEKYKWAHIDNAGTAWASGKDKGATGRPVPLLTQYIIDQI